MSNERSSDTVNSLVAALHAEALAQTAAEMLLPVPLPDDAANEIAAARDDRLREIADSVPYYGKSDRENITTMPSLLGSWVAMFIEIEDAYHKATDVTKETSDQNEVIRTIAKEIALAVHHYVSKATVNTKVNATTGVPPMANAGGPVAGFGQGAGKLS